MNTAIRNNMPERELAMGGAKSDPAMGKWSTVETLLAVLIDEVRTGNWLYASAHSEKTVPRPDPVRRPGLPARREKRISLADAQRLDPRLKGLGEEEAQAMLDRMTGRGGGG